MNSRESSSPPPADDPAFLTSPADLNRSRSEPDGAPRRLADVNAPLINIPGQRPLLDLFPLFFPSESEAPPPLATGPIAQARKALPTYEGFFGLREHPFSLAADSRFLYRSRAHDRAVQEVLSAIGRHDPLVVATGNPGMGKTMLCRTLVEQLDRLTVTSLVTQPFISIEELLKTLLVDFGVMSRSSVLGGRLQHATRTELASALREFVASPERLAFAVVIIDDAHNLSTELLEELRALSEPAGRLQAVLVGEPDLLTTLRELAASPLIEGATVQTSLDALGQDEVADFLFHRLEVAGNPHIDFDDGALARLARLSGGVPRLVNLLGDRALAEAHRSSIRAIDRPIVDLAAAALDLLPPPSKASRRVLTGLLFVFLLFAGAATAAYVFQSQLAAILNS